MYGMVGGKWRDEFKYKGGLKQIGGEHFGYQSAAQEQTAARLQKEAVAANAEAGQEG
jgi:hypothetical protein